MRHPCFCMLCNLPIWPSRPRNHGHYNGEHWFYETNRCESAPLYPLVLEPDISRHSEGDDGHSEVLEFATSSPGELVMYCKAIVSPLLQARVVNVEKRAAIRYPLAEASRSPSTSTKHVREDHPYNLLSRRPWPAATDIS